MDEVLFLPETHQYFIGDMELPSVTTIVRFCNYDSKNERGNDPFYRDRGTTIHALCTDIDLTGEIRQGTGYDGYLKAYSDFLRDYRIKDWLFVEGVFGSAELGFAGTIDRIGVIIDGCLWIVDIKTGKINKRYLSAQLTGYKKLFLYYRKITRAPHIPIKLAGIKLQSNGKYQLVPVDADYELFHSCLVMNQRIPMPKQKEKTI